MNRCTGVAFTILLGPFRVSESVTKLCGTSLFAYTIL
jgi:hypothetical protein